MCAALDRNIYQQEEAMSKTFHDATPERERAVIPDLGHFPKKKIFSLEISEIRVLMYVYVG